MRSMSVFVAPEDEASSFWKRGLKEIVVVVVVVVVVKKRIIIIIINNNNSNNNTKKGIDEISFPLGVKYRILKREPTTN